MIQSVMKALKIMELFSPAEPRLSLHIISQRLHMPKSTTHNLLNTLVASGYVEKVDGDQYALGTAIVELTQNVRVNVELRDRAAPLLRRLADSSHESVYLTVRDGRHVLYIYAIESSQRLVARTAVGERAEMHCTSVGKATLAFLPSQEVDRLYKDAILARYTANTIVDLGTLKQELAATHERGYSVDNQEHEENIFCVGAPIFGERGLVLGACSVSGTEPAIVGSRLPLIGASVAQTAQEISRHMGYIPSRGSIARVAAL
jgi:DNA-binding IclR family transcriptional regulator